MTQLLSAGEFAVAPDQYQYQVKDAQDDGAPIKNEPFVEPVFPRPQGMALMKTAKHPAAAVLFADWLVGPGQEVLLESNQEVVAQGPQRHRGRRAQADRRGGVRVPDRGMGRPLREADQRRAEGTRARVGVSARSIVRDARTSIRYARRLPSFVRGRVTPEQARQEIERKLARADDGFLDVLERGVFAVDHSPYRPLFAGAGAELGDVRAMVAGEGLEGALAALLDAGVTVSLDEFKQRADEFDNPLATRHFSTLTGGSRTAPRRVGLDLGRVEYDCSPPRPLP